MAQQVARPANLIMEDVRIVFRNFTGKEGRFNKEGDRNFAVILDHEVAGPMMEDGWNVKFLKPREEGDEPQPYIQVAVSYRIKPPRIVLITSRGRTNLGEEEVDILDWIDIKKVDLILNASPWEVNGKRGIKAYLKSFFVTMEEDALELKYADVPDSAQNVLEGGHVPLQIEAGGNAVELGELPPWDVD